MMTQEQQDRLTRVGPGAPMGELLRRYWMPLAPSHTIAPGAARAVRILREDLVVFRTPDSQLGLLEEHCPHRRSSLAHGCVDAGGIRCPYHGWRFDARGNCLEMPPEPPDTKLLATVKATSYRVEELGGLIFGYLGPEPAPLLPRWDLFVWDNVLRDIGIARLPCNWFQIMENSVDPCHVEWLHGRHLAHVRGAMGQSIPTHYQRPHQRIGFDEFEFGIIKRRILEGGSELDDDWAVGHPLVFPNIVRVGSHGQHRFQIRVPIDDTHTQHYWYSCYRPAPGVVAPPQIEVPSYEVPWRNERGEFLLDFVDGQDIMAWVTQGPIADRTRENLGRSDEGILLLRRLFLKQLERLEAGDDPMGVVRDPVRNQIIELPQEREKYGRGANFLSESMEMGHARYSPLRDLAVELLSRPAPGK